MNQLHAWSFCRCLRSCESKWGRRFSWRMSEICSKAGFLLAQRFQPLWAAALESPHLEKQLWTMGGYFRPLHLFDWCDVESQLSRADGVDLTLLFLHRNRNMTLVLIYFHYQELLCAAFLCLGTVEHQLLFCSSSGFYLLSLVGKCAKMLWCESVKWFVHQSSWKVSPQPAATRYRALAWPHPCSYTYTFLLLLWPK